MTTLETYTKYLKKAFEIIPYEDRRGIRITILKDKFEHGSTSRSQIFLSPMFYDSRPYPHNYDGAIGELYHFIAEYKAKRLRIPKNKRTIFRWNTEADLSTTFWESIDNRVGKDMIKMYRAYASFGKYARRR